ncbi:hypothetical protein GIB67_028311 [Kingdonia uniflora]|uniref:Uncharacterized protein n=1 Tax=Kingdonia uniflora TaxID=39325 RepID=A0A7J7MHM3_9MAGN|nr:hypothetical protein GIB67_028311 [Kingdonia uniflora]
MVKTQSMVLEERIASEMERLKLKYFGNHSLEMAIPAPTPPSYQGLLGEEAVEAEEDFYYKWRFHVFVLTDEECWDYLRTLAEDRGNCLQRDDEEPLDLRFRSVKQSVKSTVEKKESLLDEVVEEETELELVLEGLSLSRKKKVDSRSNKVRKAQSTRSMAGVDDGKRQVSGEEVQTNLSKTPGTGSLAQLNPVKSSKVAQKYLKKQMLKALPASGTTRSGEVTKDKRKVKPSEESGEKVAKGRSASVDDLKEVEERARLAALQGEEDTSKMVPRLVKGIWLGGQVAEGFSCHGDWLAADGDKGHLDEMAEECNRLGHHLILKGYSEEEVDTIKADTYIKEEDEEEAEAVGIADGLDGVSRQTIVREMSLRINDLESGLYRERETFKSLLSAQAELQAVSDLTRQAEEKDSNVKNGLKELAEVTERTEKLQRQVDMLAVKSKQADMAQYCIQVMEQSEGQFRSDIHNCRNELERMRQKFIEKDDELRGAQENLSASEAAAEHLQTSLPAKDMKFREMQ